MNAIIIVRYENDKNDFILKLKSLAIFFKIYVYDNSLNSIDCFIDNVYYKHDPSNSGLAVALNHCINCALNDNISLCTYFDQDSKIDISLINNLFSSYNFLEKSVNNLFVLGPQPIMVNGDLYPIRLIGSYSRSYWFANEIITSGMTFDPRKVKSIGYFDEDLFLDLVDFELCWRAISNQMSIFVDKNILMVHEVGVKTIKIPFKILPISSPIRNYYQMRNLIYIGLFKRNKNPIIVLYYLTRRSFNVFINFLFADQKLLRLKYNYLGIRHALRRNMGKLNSLK